MYLRPRLTAIAGLSVLSLMLIGSVTRAQEYRLSDFESQQYSAVPTSCGCGELSCDSCGQLGCGQSGCDTCGCDDCGCSSACGPRFWLRADYLMWWTKGNRMPPLVTTSPNGTDRDEAGVLGFDTTTVLYGGERVDANFRNGVRYRAGMWLDACSRVGIDVHYLYLDDGANTGDYFGSSLGDPILARPFFNTQLNAEDSQLIAFPGVVQGQIDIQTSSEMHSAGILLRQAWLRGGSTSVDLVGGYRYFRYREGLSIDENLLLLDTPGFPNDTTLDVRDTFSAENNFHGGEIGINSTYCHRGFVIDLLAKVAVGNVHQDLEVSGQTVRTVPNTPPVTDDMGFLTLPTNIGHRTRNQFAFLPEVNLDIRYPLTHSLQLTAGYSLLYLTKVVRTGDQIDTVINPTQFPQNGGNLVGPARPAPLFQDTAIWAQGLNLGIEWVY